jgi:hypothetical protein
MSESIGNVAGQLWQYLDKKGSQFIAKIAKEADIEMKQLQRSIGRLAKEDKITI